MCCLVCLLLKGYILHTALVIMFLINRPVNSHWNDEKLGERRVHQKYWHREERSIDLLSFSSLCLTSGFKVTNSSLQSQLVSVKSGRYTVQHCMNKRVEDKEEVFLRHSEGLSWNYTTLAHSRSIFLPLKHCIRSTTNILWQFIHFGLKWWLYCQ